MGRWGRSVELVEMCCGVHKELVVFPIVSAVAVVLVTSTFVVPGCRRVPAQVDARALRRLTPGEVTS